MKKHFSGPLCAVLILSLTLISWKPVNAKKHAIHSKKHLSAGSFIENYADNVFEAAHLGEYGLAQDVFKKALTGFIDLKIANKLPQNASILTVIDFTKSSCKKRMWIIDVVNKSLVLHTWVAHGNGSGDNIPTRFSDKNDSHKSSLGFFITDQVYYGKHGRSLKLDGMDAGFNTNARFREIVIHAADYVNQAIIDQKGRLGRSQGCPAVAPEVADQVIDSMKDKTVLFIYGHGKRYNSKYLDERQAANFLQSNSNSEYISNL